MRLITWLVTNAVALAVATWLVPGIRFNGPTVGQDELQQKLVPLLVVAVVLGLLTSFVKPVLKVLSFPFILLTLGLFLLVINAGLLLLAGVIARELDVPFRVVDFWPSAVVGAVIITVVTWVVDGVIGDDR
jgi:putative membrane protein